LERKKPIEVSLNMKCPVCYKSSLKLRYIETDIPYLGKAVIMSIKCKNCGFKTTDTIFKEHKEKKELEVTITKENLGDILVITGYSLIKIPKLGLELEFKTENIVQITTLEGVLMMFLDSLKSYNPDTVEERKKIELLTQKIKREIKRPSGNLKITVKDIVGKSIIIPKAEWIKKVEKERENY